jgi:hypothetical protein
MARGQGYFPRQPVGRGRLMAIPQRDFRENDARRLTRIGVVSVVASWLLYGVTYCICRQFDEQESYRLKNWDVQDSFAVALLKSRATRLYVAASFMLAGVGSAVLLFAAGTRGGIFRIVWTEITILSFLFFGLLAIVNLIMG